MTAEEILRAIQERVAKAGDLRGTVKFVIDGDKIVHIDATQTPPSISTEDKQAQCTVRLSADTFEDLITGKGSAMTAFMFGKIKVEGDMGIAMAISRIL
jgi:putative sterol carrier protein